MKKIIIILIITLTTFMGENIYTNNKELKQNEYIANDVEIENKAEDKTSENILIIPEENEVIMKDNEIQETTDNEVIEEYISVEKSVATPKEEKKNEQPKTQKVQEVQKEETKVENIQQKEETKVVETKTEPIKEPEPVTPKCDGSNHGVGVGNSNKWFNTQQEAINYFDGIQKTWGDKWEKFEIDSATYDKNCPYGYEVWTCPFCGKWTIDFFYEY